MGLILVVTTTYEDSNPRTGEQPGVMATCQLTSHELPFTEEEMMDKLENIQDVVDELVEQQDEFSSSISIDFSGSDKEFNLDLPDGADNLEDAIAEVSLVYLAAMKLLSK